VIRAVLALCALALSSLTIGCVTDECGNVLLNWGNWGDVVTIAKSSSPCPAPGKEPQATTDPPPALTCDADAATDSACVACGKASCCAEALAQFADPTDATAAAAAHDCRETHCADACAGAS
jgi:hypothetical protein